MQHWIAITSVDRGRCWYVSYIGGNQVGARIYANDAWNGQCFFCFDVVDVGMGNGCSYKYGVQLTIYVEIVTELSSAGQQGKIFTPHAFEVTTKTYTATTHRPKRSFLQSLLQQLHSYQQQYL